MKYHVFLAVLITVLTSTYVYSEEWTDRKALVRIQNSGGGVTYFLTTRGESWGLPSCPNALYAVMYKNLVGFEEMFSLALLAKTAGTDVKFQATCNPPNSNGTISSITVSYIISY